MLVLITYDVCTETSAGRNRLRMIAKACESHAQRVQNSVFEADLDWSSFMKLKSNLLKIMDVKEDSIRFYYLGNNWKRRIEHFGTKESYDPEGTIII
jgi:CRISPR-associated protein Cas2